MILAVSGSRSITDRSAVYDALNSFIRPTVILHGSCRDGVDAIADRWARERDVRVIRYPADWLRHGRAAGPIRNQEMVDQADALLAIWDGRSRGTKNAIECGRRRGIPVWVIEV